jgi:hypothetical protein
MLVCKLKTCWPNSSTNQPIVFNVYGSVHRKNILIYISNKTQRYTVYFIWKLLYLFRVVPLPIIRSANNCICSIWYLSHRYCHLPLYKINCVTLHLVGYISEQLMALSHTKIQDSKYGKRRPALVKKKTNNLMESTLACYISFSVNFILILCSCCQDRKTFKLLSLHQTIPTWLNRFVWHNSRTANNH